MTNFMTLFIIKSCSGITSLLKFMILYDSINIKRHKETKGLNPGCKNSTFFRYPIFKEA